MRVGNKIVGLFAASAIILSSIVIPTAANGSSTPSSSHSFSSPSRPSTSSSSSGFSKPSAPSVASTPSSSGGGFSKPTTSAPPVASTPPAPSSNGFSKPTPAPSAPVASPSNNGFSKPNSAPVSTAGNTTAPPRPAAPASAMATANNKAVSSSTLSAYQAERSQARQPPMPVASTQVRSSPVYSSASRAWGGNADTYYSRRTVVYSSYRSSHPDVFIITHNMRPNYGIYDSGFLTGMMFGYIGSSMIHNASWMYAQQSQPWYPAYRADLERQAVDNAELRAKMYAMDAEIAKLKAQGVQPQTTNSLPQGVDPAMAIAPEAVMADAPEKPSYTWLWIILAAIGGGVVVFFVVRRR